MNLCRISTLIYILALYGQFTMRNFNSSQNQRFYQITSFKGLLKVPLMTQKKLFTLRMNAWKNRIRNESRNQNGKEWRNEWKRQPFSSKRMVTEYKIDADDYFDNEFNQWSDKKNQCLSHQTKNFKNFKKLEKFK